MRDHRDGKSSRRGAGVLLWTERLFVIVGGAMLVWCALFVTDTSVSQRAAHRTLETASHSETFVYPRGSGSLPAVPRTPLPAPAILRGSAIADLSIPRVHLSAVVLHGSDAQTLRRGPGHVENTAMPGESGNIVIAGHRDSFFRPLRDVHLGDDIFLGTPQGNFHYRVTSLRVVNPHDLTVLETTDGAVLTLITCFPFWVLGHAPDRFIVRASAVVDPTAPAFAPLMTSPGESIQLSAVPAPAEDDAGVLTAGTVP